MLNKVQLIGRLGADPEIRTLTDGGKVTSMSLATTETWKSSETRHERTEWHRITVWGEGSANYLEYACKGSLVLVEGKLTTRKWTDKEGAERYTTEIVVQRAAGGHVKILADGVGADRSEGRAGRSRQDQAGLEGADPSEEIPF
jgi:single-strand DNA-binding protein